MYYKGTPNKVELDNSILDNSTKNIFFLFFF